MHETCRVLQCVAVCCSVLQCVAVCCCVLQCVAVCCFVLLCIIVCETESRLDTIYSCARPHSFVCVICGSFIRETHIIHTGDTHHSYVRHTSFIRETHIIHV